MLLLQSENKKGYFEKFAVVNQNDALLKNQQTHWSANDLTYDPSAVLQQIMQVPITSSLQLYTRCKHRFARIT
jgi:hypothetical protein